MKLLFDFLPVLLFFATYKYAQMHKEWAAAFAATHIGFMVSGGEVGADEAPVLLATLVVIAATLLQVAWLRLRGRRIDLMLWIGLALVVVLGGATVWFHNETFIKWKPSALYWAMGLTFWVSRTLFRKNLLRALMGEQIVLPDRVWQRLNFAWVAFFAFMGLLNLWVAYSFPTDVWVDFKLFGGLGLMLLFTVGQALYMSRHLKDDPPKPEADQPEALR
jgi:intracellular septation protein